LEPFEEALARGETLLLDGGLATELERRGIDLDTELWSAALLRDDPQAIVDVHRSYLEAGADCLISASYQASREGLQKIGLHASEADELIASSVSLAIAARRQFLDESGSTQRVPLVAASVGPYGAILHDGSEYTGDYDTDRASLTEFHAARLSLLDASAADILACETIPNAVEAGVLAELLVHASTPAWVSFCCRDSAHVSDGSRVRDTAAMFAGHPRVFAVGVNCTAPQYVEGLIAEVRAGAPDKAIVVYPNSGEIYDAATNSWSGIATPLEFGKAALSWRRAGAQIIGGCCRTGPLHIAAMKASLS
jgi:homocysteine S-methyltransferase